MTLGMFIFLDLYHLTVQECLVVPVDTDSVRFLSNSVIFCHSENWEKFLVFEKNFSFSKIFFTFFG